MGAETLWEWRDLKHRRRSIWVKQRLRTEGNCADEDDATKWPILGIGYFNYGTGWGKRESTPTRPGMSVRGTTDPRDQLTLYIYTAEGRIHVKLGCYVTNLNCELVYNINVGFWPLKKGRVQAWVNGVRVADQRVRFHVKPGVYGWNHWRESWDGSDCILFVEEMVVATRKHDVLPRRKQP